MSKRLPNKKDYLGTFHYSINKIPMKRKVSQILLTAYLTKIKINLKSNQNQLKVYLIEK